MSGQAEKAAPPTLFGSLILCGLLTWGTVQLFMVGQAGNDGAAFGSVVLGVFSLITGLRVFSAFDRLVDRVRLWKQYQALAHQKGKAKLGDLQAAKKARLLGKEGMIFGSMGGKWLRFSSEASGMVTGPPGSMKGVAFVILNLLLAPKVTAEKFVSYIVLDISGELYAVCARTLKALGYRVIAIGPEVARMAEELGIEIEALTNNPLAYLDPTNPNILEDVDTCVMLIYPGGEPGKKSGNVDHFDDLGRQILTTFVLWMLAKYGSVTLTGLRRCIMSTKDEKTAVLEAALQRTDFGGSLAENAASILSMMEATDEFSGALNTATRAVRLFANGSPVGNAVSENGLLWGELKERGTVVFIMVPSERLKSQAQWLNLTISASAEALVRHRSNQKVIYLFDEFASIFLPKITDIVSQYRKNGLQLFFILQQASAQISRIYGKETFREIESNCEIVMAIATRDLDELKRLSALTGEETVPDASQTIREGAGGNLEPSYTGTFSGRPVLRPEAIRQLPPNIALLLYRNAPPFLVDLVSYLDVVPQLADENPYYRKK